MLEQALKGHTVVGEEMVLWLRVLVGIAENLNSIPSTHMGKL